MVLLQYAFRQVYFNRNPKHITQMKQENRKENKERKEKANFSSVMQLRLTARQRSHLMIQASRKATTVPTILRNLILNSIKND